MAAVFTVQFPRHGLSLVLDHKLIYLFILNAGLSLGVGLIHVWETLCMRTHVQVLLKGSTPAADA